MTPTAPFADDNPLRQAVRAQYHADERECVAQLLAEYAGGGGADERARTAHIARELVTAIRADRRAHGGLDAFLHEYQLSGEEGVALMCLAEALLRIPDARTADALIEDKLAGADWKAHLGQSESVFVNVSTWALMLTGKALDAAAPARLGRRLTALLARSGEPLIRAAIVRAMKIMGRQFVLAEDIHAALRRARAGQRRGYSYSYDMLGEAARTAADAQRYFDAYLQAIEAIGAHAAEAAATEAAARPGISVKLSALHPRYEFAQAARMMRELLPRMRALCMAARRHDIGLTIDAEESERLDPSMSLLEALAPLRELRDWDGLGFAVQAYQKRAPALLDWLRDLAEKSKLRLMIRLVKGAYWDREIKHAQVHGFADYPVFTRKAASDVSYLVCARALLAHPARFFPLFATHNAHSVAAILACAGARRDFEFQCLHGMGETLYAQVLARHNAACRIYAPVGPHRELLAYLVRRLLENGANTSFVGRLVDKQLPLARILRDPAETLAESPAPHPRIPTPPRLYAPRANSAGMNWFDSATLAQYYRAVGGLRTRAWEARAVTPGGGAENVAGVATASTAVTVINPASGESVGAWRVDGERDMGVALDANSDSAADGDVGGAEPRTVTPGGGANTATTATTVTNPATGESVGTWRATGERDINVALDAASAAAADWDARGADARAAVLEAAADLFEHHRDEFLYLCAAEAGKTLPDAISEVREAVDFLRYYAARARRDFAPHALPGPTGECNQLQLHGRGVFACISPWNFPLAIFAGQIGAALAAGNCVIAKPAEQTPLIAAHACALLHRAGAPAAVLQCLPGGAEVGARLVADARIDAVAFTGSVAAAKRIHCALAQHAGAIRPLLAETGGINAMIVDSSALPEQVTADVIASAFQSAGQRCSALRVLYLQREIADDMLRMLRGAMAELQLGDPLDPATDIGPIIDRAARERLNAHVTDCRNRGFRVTIGAAAPRELARRGNFFSPVIIEVGGIADIGGEVFGPVLHIARFASADMERVVDDINAAGYGLTFGIHSRIQSVVARIRARIKVGNLYVNRNVIGAVVGAQPFGGERLSGTGPKAGGPNYLRAFAVERATSIDTTAAGGNASLLSLGGE
ncbi:MAG: L-glutamate gamma-semialdehyde dehydrogenase [Gammaproteobacteria bacterium]